MMVKKKLNLIFMFFNPGFNNFTMMDTQIIQNQIYFPAGVFNQTPKELYKDLRVHSFIVDHEPNLALIGDRGNQIDSFALCTKPGRTFTMFFIAGLITWAT